MTKRWGPNCTSDLGKSKRQAAKEVRADALRHLRSELEANQERLGPEFEAVLFDDLWGLYARA